MKKIFLILLLLLLPLKEARASALSDAINNCALRTWCEITSSVNLTSTWLTDGASGFFMGYATELKWDSHGRKLYFVGMDHANDVGDMPTTEVVYSNLPIPGREPSALIFTRVSRSQAQATNTTTTRSM